MPAINLTDRYLRNLKPTGKRFEITDSSSRGLRARVSATGQITFLIKARDATSKLQTVTIGHYPEVSLKDARDKAAKSRLELKSGHDLNGQKRARRQAARVQTSNLTLRELLREYEAAFGATKRMWAPAGPRTTRTQAGRVIERVFAELLDNDVTTITEEDFASAIMSYERAKPSEGKKTANGQVSRSRAYLSPVLDWAAGRKKFARIGAGRSPRLMVVSLANTHDPATGDATITGKRKRVLSQDELQAVLPLLKYPAPQIGKLKADPRCDYRPVAMRFILHTASRLEEVCAMKWRDIDRRNSVLHKPKVKSTRGGPRSQDLPLSEAAMSILRDLPGWTTGKPGDYVFPNSKGTGKLGNWTRFQNALNETSGTSGWHRHDLRRSAATLMRNLKVPPSTIGHILAHTDPLKGEHVGGAASSYLQITQIITSMRDPQEEALSMLASALKIIEDGVQPTDGRDQLLATWAPSRAS